MGCVQLENIVVSAAKRTAIGRFGGSLKDISAPNLGAYVIKACIEEIGVDVSDVEQVIMGNVLMGGLGQNPARQASVLSGIGYSAPAFTVNMVCGSGLKAIEIAYNTIRCGDAKLIIAGGMENMSAAPYILRNACWGSENGGIEN